VLALSTTSTSSGVPVEHHVGRGDVEHGRGGGNSTFMG
jgi:hypothetical protein